jgi:hypothetical protein
VTGNNTRVSRRWCQFSPRQGGRAFIDAELIKPRHAVPALSVLFPCGVHQGRSHHLFSDIRHESWISLSVSDLHFWAWCFASRLMLVSFWMDMGYRDQAIDGRMGRDIDEHIPCLWDQGCLPLRMEVGQRAVMSLSPHDSRCTGGEVDRWEAADLTDLCACSNRAVATFLHAQFQVMLVVPRTLHSIDRVVLSVLAVDIHSTNWVFATTSLASYSHNHHETLDIIATCWSASASSTTV